jgi:hypothetical protein
LSAQIVLARVLRSGGRAGLNPATGTPWASAASFPPDQHSTDRPESCQLAASRTSAT